MKLNHNEQYCISSGYVSNEIALTTSHGGQKYWNERRLKYSAQYQWYVYKWAKQLMIERGLKFVVDVGCGPGVKLRSLIKPCAQRAVGIDQAAAIDYCKQVDPQGEYVVDDFSCPRLQLDFVPDLVICCDVIEHLLYPDILLDYIRRLCDSRTLLLISTPDRDRLRGKGTLSCPNRQHVREWAANEFDAYLKKKNWRILDKKHFPPVKIGFSVLALVHYIRQLKPGLRFPYNYCVLSKMA